MKYSVLFDSLQNLINYKPTANEVASCLGVKDKALYARRARNSEFTYEELIKIENAYGIVGGLTGGIIQNNNTVEIDFYPDVFASCGFGLAVISEQKEKISVPKGNIKNYSEHKKYSVVTAQGESMQPYILNNDKLIIEHTDTIQDNKVHIFAYKDDIYVKRLIKNINEIVIVSDNSNKEIYSTQKVTDFSELRVIGQVIGLMRDM
jgi:SOS-response transcriptional repressor LexA